MMMMMMMMMIGIVSIIIDDPRKKTTPYSREKDRRDTRARPRGGEESGETIHATLEKVEQNREE